MSKNRGITLFTSDSRPKYITDVFNVLALPEGFIYKFRYDKAYISSDIQESFDGKSILGTSVLISFISKIRDSDAGFNNPDYFNFIVPIRWGVIRNVSLEHGFYVILFEIKGYPVYENLFPDDKTKIVKASFDYIFSLPETKRALPVHEGFPHFVKLQSNQRNGAWSDVVSRLSLHSIFESIHFLHVSSFIKKDSFFISTKKLKIHQSDEGDFLINGSNYVEIKVQYLAKTYSECNTYINIESDDDFIRLASPKKHSLSSRYDSIDVMFEVKPVTGDTRTQIEIYTFCESSNSPQAHLTIPCLVKKSNSKIAVHFSLNFLGSFFISIPPILVGVLSKISREFDLIRFDMLTIMILSLSASALGAIFLTASSLLNSSKK
jgi:hypothetical protein